MIAPLVLAAALALQAPSPGTRLLVVSGAGGDAQYRETFHTLGAKLAGTAVTHLGLSDSSVIFLAEDSARPPARGRSTRAGLTAALAEMARRARSDERIVIVLIGHGSHQGGTSRFNLPGPDIAAGELAQELERFGSRTVAVVNTSSASGEWVRPLAAPNRVVITATKSGFEGNATLFPRFFVDAFATDGADTDKDGSVSLLEAYQFARREVARAFEQGNRLLTEHAQLDDNGDGTPTADPLATASGAAGADGLLARRMVLRASTAAAPSADPRLAALYAERDLLVKAVEDLRTRKARTDSAAYEVQLERLLLALANLNGTIRAAGGTP